MPQLGETVTEGTITRWLKQVGDPIGQDEVLFEVSTDKVDSEVPSPSAGYLAEILVPEGSQSALSRKHTVAPAPERSADLPRQLDGHEQSPVRFRPAGTVIAQSWLTHASCPAGAATGGASAELLWSSGPGCPSGRPAAASGW